MLVQTECFGGIAPAGDTDGKGAPADITHCLTTLDPSASFCLYCQHVAQVWLEWASQTVLKVNMHWAQIQNLQRRVRE